MIMSPSGFHLQGMASDDLTGWRGMALFHRPQILEITTNPGETIVAKKQSIFRAQKIEVHFSPDRKMATLTIVSTTDGLTVKMSVEGLRDLQNCIFRMLGDS